MPIRSNSGAGVHQRLFSTIQRTHKPIVAAVHGSVFDGGTGLAANAHIVVAHRETCFGLTEVLVGYWPSRRRIEAANRRVICLHQARPAIYCT